MIMMSKGIAPTTNPVSLAPGEAGVGQEISLEDVLFMRENRTEQIA
jgi:hypothetical protein